MTAPLAMAAGLLVVAALLLLREVAHSLDDSADSEEDSV